MMVLACGDSNIIFSALHKVFGLIYHLPVKIFPIFNLVKTWGNEPIKRCLAVDWDRYWVDDDYKESTKVYGLDITNYEVKLVQGNHYNFSEAICILNTISEDQYITDIYNLGDLSVFSFKKSLVLVKPKCKEDIDQPYRYVPKYIFEYFVYG